MWPTIKKYGKYALILLLGVGAVVLFVLVRSWLKKRGEADDGSEHVEKLADVINEIGAQMTEAKHQAKVEIEAARAEESVLKATLKEVVSTTDKKTRRKRLADLYAEVSR